MRLSEIRKIILDNMNQLELIKNPNGTGSTSITNVVDVVNAIQNLSVLPFLSPTINALKTHSNLYTSRSQPITASNNDVMNFERLSQELFRQCETIVALSNSVLPPTNEQLICIQLSETANISDVKKLITSLDEAFSQISNLKNYEGSVKFGGFESGSDWINLVVEGSAYIPLIYLLLNASYRIANDYYNIKLMQQRYKGAIIQNESNEELRSMLKTMSSAVINQLKDTEQIKVEPEETERLVLWTTKIASAIADGNKVLASLTAPAKQQTQLNQSAAEITSKLEELKLLTSPSDNTDSETAYNDPIA